MLPHGSTADPWSTLPSTDITAISTDTDTRDGRRSNVDTASAGCCTLDCGRLAPPPPPPTPTHEATADLLSTLPSVRTALSNCSDGCGTLDCGRLAARPPPQTPTHDATADPSSTLPAPRTAVSKCSADCSFVDTAGDCHQQHLHQHRHTRWQPTHCRHCRRRTSSTHATHCRHCRRPTPPPPRPASTHVVTANPLSSQTLMNTAAASTNTNTCGGRRPTVDTAVGEDS